MADLFKRLDFMHSGSLDKAQKVILKPKKLQNVAGPLVLELFEYILAFKT